MSLSWNDPQVSFTVDCTVITVFLSRNKRQSEKLPSWEHFEFKCKINTYFATLGIDTLLHLMPANYRLHLPNLLLHISTKISIPYFNWEKNLYFPTMSGIVVLQINCWILSWSEPTKQALRTYAGWSMGQILIHRVFSLMWSRNVWNFIMTESWKRKTQFGITKLLNQVSSKTKHLNRSA